MLQPYDGLFGALLHQTNLRKEAPLHKHGKHKYRDALAVVGDTLTLPS